MNEYWVEDPQTHLVENYDVDRERLEQLSQTVEASAEQIFEQYGVEPDHPTKTFEFIVKALMNKMIQFTEELDEGVDTHLDRLESDFENGRDLHNISFLAGAHSKDEPGLRKLSNELLRRKYSE